MYTLGVNSHLAIEIALLGDLNFSLAPPPILMYMVVCYTLYTLEIVTSAVNLD